jgi:hypothetical protein
MVTKAIYMLIKRQARIYSPVINSGGGGAKEMETLLQEL